MPIENGTNDSSTTKIQPTPALAAPMKKAHPLERVDKNRQPQIIAEDRSAANWKGQYLASDKERETHPCARPRAEKEPEH